MRSGHGDYLPWLSRKLASWLKRICKIKPYDERGRGKDMEESICRQRQIFVFACSRWFSLRNRLFRGQFALLFARVLLYRPYFSESVRKLAVFAVFTPTGLDESVLLTYLAEFGMSLTGFSFVIRFFRKAARGTFVFPLRKL
jgi:hypothetical protein